jgi:hypothetical protein
MNIETKRGEDKRKIPEFNIWSTKSKLMFPARQVVVYIIEKQVDSQKERKQIGKKKKKKLPLCHFFSCEGCFFVSQFMQIQTIGISAWKSSKKICTIFGCSK